MYHVITYSDALEQVAALPAEALLSYVEVFGVLELAPHGAPICTAAVSEQTVVVGTRLPPAARPGLRVSGPAAGPARR